MKNRQQLVADAAAYFENYPDVETFYFTGDGMAFTPQNRAEGSSHAASIRSELYEIHRNEVEKEGEEATQDHAPKVDEGPTMKWKKPDIQNWMTANGVEFDPADTIAKLLAKIADSKKDDTPDLPTVEWDIVSIKEWMGVEQIAFDEADTVEILLSKIEASKAPKE